MSDSQINIIINTLKSGFGDRDTKSALKELGAGFKSVTGLSLSYAGALTAAVAVGKKLIDITKESIALEVEKANQVRDLTKLNGEKAESESRLIEMADDQLLSYEALSKGMEAASKKGIDTSTDSLMRLSDQYLALAPGQERAKFLTDTFGKSGAEMYKIMELGSKVLKEKMAAVSDSNVLDEKAVQQTKLYQQAVDALNDSYAGLKYEIARGATPAVSKFSFGLAEVLRVMNETDAKDSFLLALIEDYKRLKAIQDSANPAMTAWSERLTAQAEAYFKLHPEIKRTTEEIEAQAEAELKAAEAITAWEQKWTSAKDAGAQFDLSLDLIKTGLEDMGKSGENAYRSILLGLGEISPAAVRAMVETEDVISKIKTMLAEGYSIDFIVNFVVNYKNGGGTQAFNPLSYNPDTGMYDAVGNSGSGSKPTSGGWVTGNYGGGKTQRRQDADGSYSYRALGGLFGAGQVMMVGEKGPEPVAFDRPGQVFPYGSLGGNITINVSGAGDPKTVAKEVMRELYLQGVGRR
ncbi:MAG: hypothetical protein AB9897_01290 [Anaerolineaceae bacterium]